MGVNVAEMSVAEVMSYPLHIPPGPLSLHPLTMNFDRRSF